MGKDKKSREVADSAILQKDILFFNTLKIPLCAQMSILTRKYLHFSLTAISQCGINGKAIRQRYLKRLSLLQFHTQIPYTEFTHNGEK